MSSWFRDISPANAVGVDVVRVTLGSDRSYVVRALLRIRLRDGHEVLNEIAVDAVPYETFTDDIAAANAVLGRNLRR